MKIGDIIEGNISGIKSYGIFISLENDKTGFCHISKLKNGFIKDIYSEFKIGQKVQAKILQIDETYKINLSLKDVNLNSNIKPQNKAIKKEFESKSSKISKTHQSFDDMLSNFIKSSDDKQKSISMRIQKHNKR